MLTIEWYTQKQRIWWRFRWYCQAVVLLSVLAIGFFILLGENGNIPGNIAFMGIFLTWSFLSIVWWVILTCYWFKPKSYDIKNRSPFLIKILSSVDEPSNFMKMAFLNIWLLFAILFAVIAVAKA